MYNRLASGLVTARIFKHWLSRSIGLSEQTNINW